MITPADFLCLPFPAELTRSAIALTCRWLACEFFSRDQKTYISIRDHVAATAADLALRRHLTAQGITYAVQGSKPYSDPSNYCLMLGGRRCLVKSRLVFDKQDIRHLQTHPEILLDQTEELNVEELESGSLREDDLLIFALVEGLITRGNHDLDRAIEAGQPICLIHTLPAKWANPLPNLPLGKVSLRSSGSREVSLDVGGRDQAGGYQEETLTLAPSAVTRLNNQYQSLAYLRSSAPLDMQVRLHAGSSQAVAEAHPGQWGNIWIYGMEILLTGYTTRGEFRRKGALRIPQSSLGKKKSLQVRELHPLAGLFEWAAVQEKARKLG